MVEILTKLLQVLWLLFVLHKNCHLLINKCIEFVKISSACNSPDAPLNSILYFFFHYKSNFLYISYHVSHLIICIIAT